MGLGAWGSGQSYTFGAMQTSTRVNGYRCRKTDIPSSFFRLTRAPSPLPDFIFQPHQARHSSSAWIAPV
jgi:hypothetical protein